MISTAWGDAFHRQDINAVVELMTPDYVLWASGAPQMSAVGLRPRLKAAFAAYEITSTFECIERLVAGDLAVDRGWDIQRLRPHGDVAAGTAGVRKSIEAHLVLAVATGN